MLNFVFLNCSRAHSSAGRALEWHSRGQEFDPPWVHLFLEKWGRSSVWLERQSVTLEAASSSLVGPAAFYIKHSKRKIPVV